MSVIAVDLAAKYSAACWVMPDGRFRRQWDSTASTEDEFITMVTDPFFPDWGAKRQLFPSLMVIEDLPHGVAYRGLVKRVCQIQGRIVDRMARNCMHDKVLFVDPRTWQSHYEISGGSAMEVAVELAGTYGYQPPDLTDRLGPRGGRAKADKIATDYCCAYLIGRWALDMFDKHGTFDVAGTARYGGNTILKAKD